MGMFDFVNVEMPCPKCGSNLSGFQSKDADCQMETIEADGIQNFYTSCRCGAWVEFSRARPNAAMRRPVPLSREQVEAMGFSLHELDN